MRLIVSGVHFTSGHTDTHTETQCAAVVVADVSLFCWATLPTVYERVESCRPFNRQRIDVTCALCDDELPHCRALKRSALLSVIQSMHIAHWHTTHETAMRAHSGCTSMTGTRRQRQRQSQDLHHCYDQTHRLSTTSREPSRHIYWRHETHRKDSLMTRSGQSVYTSRDNMVSMRHHVASMLTARLVKISQKMKHNVYVAWNNTWPVTLFGHIRTLLVFVIRQFLL